MSSRTLYIRHADPTSCIREVSARAEQAGLEINPLPRGRAGDRFSHLILGPHNFVRNNERGTEDSRRRVLEHIAHTSVIVGIPSIDDATLGTVVADLDVVVFDGTTVRDSAGDDLLA